MYANMAPPTKKKKMSKQAKKKNMADWSKKALEQRGLVAGRRRKFALAANWKEEKYKSGNQTRVKFISPGKTTYKTLKAAGEAFIMGRSKNFPHPLSEGLILTGLESL